MIMAEPYRKAPVNKMRKEIKVGIEIKEPTIKEKTVVKESTIKESLVGEVNAQDNTKSSYDNNEFPDLQFNRENIIQGVIFQELLNKPLALRRGFRRY